MIDSRRSFVDSVSDWFWDVVREAKQDSDRLRVILEKRSAKEIETFYQDYWTVMYELHPSHYDAERDFDEDGILLSSAWVVAHGKDHYEAVFQNPMLLPNPNTIVHLRWLDLAAEVCYERYHYHVQR